MNKEFCMDSLTAVIQTAYTHKKYNLIPTVQTNGVLIHWGNREQRELPIMLLFILKEKIIRKERRTSEMIKECYA